jgi:hypothetical protein
MTKPKPIKVTILSYEEFSEMERPVSKYYIKDALGQYVFVHVRTRDEAQKYFNEEYGNMYTVRCSGLEKNKSTNYVR